MKKILTILLIICCLFSAASCDDDGSSLKDNLTDLVTKNDETLDNFMDMLDSSAPTKSETVVTEQFNTITLTSNYTLATGTVDGKVASTLVSEVQTLNSATASQLNYITKSTNSLWYYEGLGTSSNKGASWDSEGKDFAPSAGELYMNLQARYLDTYEYSSDSTFETLVATISAENASKVLGNFVTGDYAYDTKLTIVAAGARISSITIEYYVEGYEIGDEFNPVEISDMTVKVSASYSYDIQSITLE